MKPKFHLFERFGVELEYMIVDARSLDVRPSADRLFRRVTGRVEGEIQRGALGWSNELALHIVEFKTGTPARSLEGLAERFQSEVHFANARLAPDAQLLLPGAMHPWMDPAKESRLWPHDSGEIYRTFDRIFDCRGHGWTNLQSVHLNLPFANDEEFVRLHTAIRLLMPLMPALAASSPYMEGRRACELDARLTVYRTNCARVPSITAAVVPELVRSAAEYHERILQPIYRDLAPLDPEGTLRHEWVNARGAIARFDRNTIEVRVLDLQECPAADLAILQCLTTLLARLTDETVSPLAAQMAPDTQELASLLEQTALRAGDAQVTSAAVLAAFGFTDAGAISARALWRRLVERYVPEHAPWRPWIARILEQGTLAERLVRAAGARPDRERLRMIYRRLATCLDCGEAFEAPPPKAAPPSPDGVVVQFSCEHATHAIPKRWAQVARAAGSRLTTHLGWDRGALDLAQFLSWTLKSSLTKGRNSRLLVDLNRSLGHPSLWSEFSKPLPEMDKVRILETWYLPWRRGVKAAVLQAIQAGQRIVHVGVHSFTPEWNGRLRTTDIGLLFDPARPAEARFCKLWRRALRDAGTGYRIHFNQPYRGVSDGFIPALRLEFPDEVYVGVELEVNQRFVFEGGAEWRRLRQILADKLAVVLDQLSPPEV